MQQDLAAVVSSPLPSIVSNNSSSRTEPHMDSEKEEEETTNAHPTAAGGNHTPEPSIREAMVQKAVQMARGLMAASRQRIQHAVFEAAPQIDGNLKDDNDNEDGDLKDNDKERQGANPTPAEQQQQDGNMKDVDSAVHYTQHAMPENIASAEQQDGMKQQGDKTAAGKNSEKAEAARAEEQDGNSNRKSQHALQQETNNSHDENPGGESSKNTADHKKEEVDRKARVKRCQNDAVHNTIMCKEHEKFRPSQNALLDECKEHAKYGPRRNALLGGVFDDHERWAKNEEESRYRRQCEDSDDDCVSVAAVCGCSRCAVKTKTKRDSTKERPAKKRRKNYASQLDVGLFTGSIRSTSKYTYRNTLSHGKSQFAIPSWGSKQQKGDGMKAAAAGDISTEEEETAEGDATDGSVPKECLSAKESKGNFLALERKGIMEDRPVKRRRREPQDDAATDAAVCGDRKSGREEIDAPECTPKRQRTFAEGWDGAIISQK